MQQGGDVRAHEEAVQRRQSAAAANPRGLKSGGRRFTASSPLSDVDLPLWADVAVALVISGEPAGVRVAGLGQSSEPYWIGDRAITGLPGLSQAAQCALHEAGIAARQLDLVEVDGLSLYDEAIGMEAIGIAPKGRGLAFLASDPRSNASGGGAAGYCAPAMGLLRIAEAVMQLQGRAGAIQLPRPKRALASGSCVVAAQTHTAIVLETT
jgi:acetyl-CoA C-acetyltransferase